MSAQKLFDNPVSSLEDARNVHDFRWLSIEPAERYKSALGKSLPSLVADPAVIDTLAARGIAPDMFETAVKSDLCRLAHALTVLVDFEPGSVLDSILPEHLAAALKGLDFRLDHVGREILCPIDPLLDAWHAACEKLDFLPAPQEGPSMTERGDLVFASVQVVEAIRRDDPGVEAVTIGSSFLRASPDAEPVYVELFFVGHRDGSGAQNARHMEDRLASLRFDPFRIAPPRLPICHLSVEVRDRSLLEEVHRIGQADHSGLVKPYVERISVNPGDGSHNTKLAVQQAHHPSAPTNVLEFVYFE
jgi:hypothetical protein